MINKNKMRSYNNKSEKILLTLERYNTFCYTQNVKFVHFKLFGSVYSVSESFSNETSFLRQFGQAILIMSFFYNGHVSYTFCYTENVKFVHFKLYDVTS